MAGTIHLDVRPTYASGNTAAGGIADNSIGVTDNSLGYSFTPALNGNSLDFLVTVTVTGLTRIEDRNGQSQLVRYRRRRNSKLLLASMP